MTDRKGNVAKRHPECRIDEAPPRCPCIECTYEGFDGERYRCKRCGESYFLDYGEMA